MTVSSTPALTRSVEDYLKVIYRLSRDGQPAATSAIAQALLLAPPSVSGMIRRLSEQGLLEHVPYRGVALTPEGRRAAVRMVRRHRIIEAYLVGRLGYTWDTVHDEADRLEHAVSEELIERMADALGNPAFDPHGDPIPDADGRVTELLYTPLGDIGVGERVQLRRVDTSEPDRLRFLGGLGLVPGAVFVVAGKEPSAGPMSVELEGRRHVLGNDLARVLLCARYPRPA